MATSPDSGAGGGGFGQIFAVGNAVARGINSLLGTAQGWNKKQRAAVASAQAQGYRREARGRFGVWRDPAGNLVTEKQVMRAGRNPPPSPAIGPGATGGPKNPRAVLRGGGPIKQEPDELPGPWEPPVTDSELEQFYEESGLPGTIAVWAPEYGWQFTPRPPAPPPEQSFAPAPWIKPPSWETIGAGRGPLLGGILAGILRNPLWWIFWPGKTADDDTWPGVSKGPRRRPRIRRRRQPEPDPQPSQWPSADPIPQPSPLPGPQPAPQPAPQPGPGPGTSPGAWPIPYPWPLPSPPPRTTRPPLWPYLLPLILDPRAPIQRNPLTDQPPSSSPDAPGEPLTAPQPWPLQFQQPIPRPNDDCERTKRKRKKRKPRTVCYSGTYTERRTGLRKRKKRKIPCR